MPFDRVPAILAFFTGVTITPETARRLTEAAGAAQVAVETMVVEYLEATWETAPPGPAVQHLSADGAMVPLVGGEWAEVKTLAVGTVEMAVGGEAHTTALSYFSRLANAEAFGRLATVETHRRGTETAGTVVAVMDVAEWLQGFIDLHRPDAVRILDFPHAAEHLSLAAQAVFGVGTAAASEWLGTQRHELRHGDPDQVLVALCRLPVERATCPAEAAMVQDGVVSYLAKRREQLAYADFVAHGYPIGSGSVESANKVVVEGRLKGGGMHWARRNVNPMVALRAMECSGRWVACWPVLWQQWRRMIRQTHQARRAARIAALQAATAPPASQPPHRVPTVIDGRPTAEHPWKKYPLLPGSRPYTARARAKA
jgi:hypothetical protein